MPQFVCACVCVCACHVPVCGPCSSLKINCVIINSPFILQQSKHTHTHTHTHTCRQSSTLTLTRNFWLFPVSFCGVCVCVCLCASQCVRPRVDSQSWPPRTANIYLRTFWRLGEWRFSPSPRLRRDVKLVLLLPISIFSHSSPLYRSSVRNIYYIKSWSFPFLAQKWNSKVFAQSHLLLWLQQTRTLRPPSTWKICTYQIFLYQQWFIMQQPSGLQRLCIQQDQGSRRSPQK